MALRTAARSWTCGERTGGSPPRPLGPGDGTTGPRRRHLRRALAAAASLTVMVGLVATSALVGGAGPAGAAPVPTGQITGTVVIQDAPVGFTGEVGLVACPSTTPSVGLCPSPQYTFSGSGGSYTLTLAAGTWTVYTFYVAGPQGGAFVGRPHTVAVAPGATVRLNVAVHYQVPSSLAGTATVTGVPSGVTIDQVQVTACPSSTPLVDEAPSPLCATDYLAQGSDQYSLPTLYKGTWLLYVGYYTLFGLTIVSNPLTVTIKKDTSGTDDLTVRYQRPANALVEGSVTVAGAPSGFSGLVGVGGCPAVGGSPALCGNPYYTLAFDGSYELVVPAGQWDLAGFYELAPFGGQFLSATQGVKLVGGTIVSLNFKVPYKKPATITSTVTVTGVPAGQTVEATTLTACPSEFPDVGGVQPIECVDSFSPAGEPNTIATLPAGKWLLYPGYETASLNEVTATTATKVTLVAGRTKVKNLSVAYQAG